MKPKIICKMTIDFIMTVLLLVLMAYNFTGDVAHEWLGAGMFVLFIIHNILNFKWYKSLLKGRYSIFRILQTIINLLVVTSMFGLMISGIILSRHVFTFLPISGGMSFARRLHMLSSYWGFIFMSLHLGLHWGMIMGMMRKAARISTPSRIRANVLQAAAVLTAAYGAYAFIKHDVISYMFLKNEFFFFEGNQSAYSFLVDYLAMMGFCVFVAYYAVKLIQKYNVWKG